jgi:hypothetical protein
MGQTAECEVVIDGKRDRGEVLLETAELIFRGASRLRIPFAAMKKVVVDAKEGSLSITWAGAATPGKGGEPAKGKAPANAKEKNTVSKATASAARTIVIPLGARAEAWAAKIKNPPGRIDKLGVKPGMAIAIWGAIEPAAVDEITARAGANVKAGRPRGGEALVFIAIDRPADLARIAEAAEKIAPDGAIWVIRRKGKDAAVSESESMAAGRAAGLYDTKVVGFSASHTAERYVIPVAHRPVKAPGGTLPRKPAVRPSRAT